MRHLIQAAFKPAPRVPGSGASGFAILPQQSEGELELSEVHSKLDWALRFLQGEVGYVLLDDARPQPGGGVQLGDGKVEDPVAARIKGRGKRSSRAPKQEPEVGDDEARQVIRFSRETAKYAHYPDDLVLVWRFASILAEAFPDTAVKVHQEALYKTVLLGIRLMHLCDYSYSDTVVTLAYASVYCCTTFAAIGHKMSSVEAAHVCVLLVYLAHCFVLDETCPLRCWQRHIFRKYCTLKVLDAALFRLFKIRGFKLRISEEDEKHALGVLLYSPNGLDVILSFGGDRGGHSRPPSTSTTATDPGEPHEESPHEALPEAPGRPRAGAAR